jgi:N-acetylmuramic acid 6-phosphate etherase
MMKENDILSLLQIAPSLRSIDYVRDKKPFQLHSLLTEQRHPKTWNLSFVLKEDAAGGLRQLFSVDEDIARIFCRLAEDPYRVTQAARAVTRAITEKKKIFLYGCGATGRLAKQMESVIWRPFWNRIKRSRFWNRLETSLPGDIEDRLIGEMTGGDRALVSSLEGFEDLQIVGKLQLLDRGVERGDVIFCITEGGETSSVIGAVLAALEQYGELTEKKMAEAKKNLYFIHNNPDDVLKPYARSRSVIDNPAITKINLATGPQAITGSTRMQATTSETFLLGVVLEAGIFGVLKEFLSPRELEEASFPACFSIKDRLRSFHEILKVLKPSVQALSLFTHLESETYQQGRFSTYFAKKALVTVFTDCTERSPTFHLYPLDTRREKTRKCWFQVWTDGKDSKSAWRNMLGRNFRGLAEAFYKPFFEKGIDDEFLRETALESLAQAGSDQEKLYDFSFSKDNALRSGPRQGDLGVLVCLDEEVNDLTGADSSFFRFVSTFKKEKANLVLILIGERQSPDPEMIAARLPLDKEKDVVISIALDKKGDPLGLNRQTLIKILLNAHSTAVMAMMGKVVGNTMTNVNPSNLKLIGRATYLIMSHVNDTISHDEWIRKCGVTCPITYEHANAVLFDAMDFLAAESRQTSEVAIAILRILEALRTKKPVAWREALAISETIGLENYLKRHNPSLRYGCKG